MAQQGPYKVLKTAKVGGAGGFDYIYADDAGRRLYIPRGAVQGPAPTPARVTSSISIRWRRWAKYPIPERMARQSIPSQATVSPAANR
jgi:hypothetical protein